MLMEEFGARLRYWRKKRGWTQTELAERADVHASTIVHLERRMFSVRLPTIECLLNALDVSIAEFFEVKIC